MTADTQRLGALGLRAARRVEEQNRRQIELAREVVDDLDRRLPVIVEKAAMGAKHAQLQREPSAMVVAAAPNDLGQICRRQAPMPREFVLARVGWNRLPLTGWRHRGREIIRRH